MLYRIDWLSFTVRWQGREDETEVTALYAIQAELRDMLGDGYDALIGEWKFEWGKGRAPYRASLVRDDHGVMIFLHPNLDHALIEVTGRGCETLGDDPRAAGLLTAITPRLTRIDVAADMLCETDPRAFVAQREPGRFRSHSEFVSESGVTCYIGSRTSNRYCRVYRYNPPHERAHLLRAEFVLKAEDAQLTAKSIISDGVDAVTVALGDAFGWQHPDWKPNEVTAAELKAWRPERREGKTLYWLADTVAPLLVRLHSEGALDVREWFSLHVLPNLPNSSTL